jgi:hypothetical protein
VIFHTPLNGQMLADRDYQEGNLRQVEMKANPDYIDGRLDQGVRNRMNLFTREGAAIADLTRTINPPLVRATHHGFTPYSYSTYWITHPPEDSALAPLKSEAYQTSFLAAPYTELDRQQRANHIQSKYDSLRTNAAGFRARVDSLSAGSKESHEKTLQNLRDQEAAYLKALEARHRIEKIYCFE